MTTEMPLSALVITGLCWRIFCPSDLTAEWVGWGTRAMELSLITCAHFTRAASPLEDKPSVRSVIKLVTTCWWLRGARANSRPFSSKQISSSSEATPERLVWRGYQEWCGFGLVWFCDRNFLLIKVSIFRRYFSMLVTPVGIYMRISNVFTHFIIW